MKLIRTLILAAAAILPFSAIAQANQIAFSTSQSEFTPGVPNEGYWSPTDCNSPCDTNYFAGTYRGQQYNDFFTFDLSCLKQTVCSATLDLKSYCHIGNAPCLTYNLYDVCAPACVVNSRNGPSPSLYKALESGPVIGAATVEACDKSDTVCIKLNSCGVKDLNCAAGGFFTIGGSIANCDPCGKDQGLFGFSSGDVCGQTLVCDTGCCGQGPGGSTVPLPVGALLVPAGIAAAMFSAKRLRRRAMAA